MPDRVKPQIFWRETKEALDAIQSLIVGDRGIVWPSDENMLEYYRWDGDEWIFTNRDTGPPGDPGTLVEFQVSATYIQWRYVGDTEWTNLIALSELEGAPGANGTNGSDGVAVELQASATHIQWRYVGDEAWTDFVALSELQGEQGDPGPANQEVLAPSTGSLSAAQLTNSIVNNYGQTSENTQTLDTPVASLNFIAVVGTSGMGNWHFKPDGSHKIYLDGVALDNGDKISFISPEVGNYCTVFAFKTGATTYSWMCLTGKGNIVDGGP